MTNMGYCRFRNTLGDLRDCHDHLRDHLISGISDGEHVARAQLVELCRKILEDCGLTITGEAEITEEVSDQAETFSRSSQWSSQ